MFFKDLFKPLFETELNQLESCKTELMECQDDYCELFERYTALAKSYNENIGKEKIVEVPVIPRDFNSFEELRLWLKDNSVSEKEYIPTTFDCEDFAALTQKQAFQDGYIINMELDWEGVYHGDGKPHMLCSTKIGNYFYIIEPQTDRIINTFPLD